MFPNAFLAHHAAHADFAKAAKFGVLIFQPTGLVAGGLFGGLIGQLPLTRTIMKPLNTAGLALQCEQANLPGYNLNVVEQKVFGSPFSIAASPGDMPPLELSFISAGDLWERKFFEDWMEFIMPKTTGRSSADTSVSDATTKIFESFVYSEGGATLGGKKWSSLADRAAGSALYRDEYISTIQVISFSDTGIPAARYTFEECYPVAVAPTPLNWADDSIIRVSVTFKYTSWSREQGIFKQIADAFKVPFSVLTGPLEDII